MQHRAILHHDISIVFRSVINQRTPSILSLTYSRLSPNILLIWRKWEIKLNCYKQNGTTQNVTFTNFSSMDAPEVVTMTTFVEVKDSTSVSVAIHLTDPSKFENMFFNLVYYYHAKQLSRKWDPKLTHWGRGTHICVSKLNITGLDNVLSPGRRQAIIWTMLEYCQLNPWEQTSVKL